MDTTTQTVFGGSVPVTELAHCVASYQAIMATLRKLDDEAARGPSLLDGWTRGHVVSHLARHADSHVRMLKGLQSGQTIPQYAGGQASRRREIERGAGRKATTLIDDFRTANEELFSVWEHLPAELWEKEVDAFGGRRPAAMLAWARWRELEVHHVDLDLGFGRQNWPLAFVMTALQRSMASLPLRSGGDELPIGTWAIEISDRPGRWVIRSTGDGVDVTADEGVDGKVDGRVEGAAADVLAWILGRLETSALTVDGSADAARLPELFPYP